MRKRPTKVERRKRRLGLSSDSEQKQRKRDREGGERSSALSASSGAAEGLGTARKGEKKSTGESSFRGFWGGGEGGVKSARGTK